MRAGRGGGEDETEVRTEGMGSGKRGGERARGQEGEPAAKRNKPAGGFWVVVRAPLVPVTARMRG